MFHDFANHHGGNKGDCDGLMNYGENSQFSDCSNFDFDIWYRKTGHRCSDPLPPTTSFRGLMIVGAEDSSRAVEIIDLDTKQQCRITDLQERRYAHAQLGDIVCGGWWALRPEANENCVSVTNQSKKWNLMKGRYWHNMWKDIDGTIWVIGGDLRWNRTTELYYSTTEVLKNDGSTEEGFQTEYYSRCIQQ